MNKKLYLLGSFFIISIVVLSLGYFFRSYIFNSSQFSNILQQKSVARVYIQDAQLKIDFRISKQDQEKVVNFSNYLGVNTDWLKGISLGLDEKSLRVLKDKLPLEVILQISDKQVNLNSFANSELDSSLPLQNYELASGSGKLKLITSGDKSYNLTITDPDQIVDFATASGKLYLSSQMQQIFPLLSKVAKITLVVKDRNVSGSILLK